MATQKPLDPMDPHGDGSIRKGDPMWEAFERALESGEVVTGEIRADGTMTIDMKRGDENDR